MKHAVRYSLWGLSVLMSLGGLGHGAKGQGRPPSPVLLNLHRLGTPQGVGKEVSGDG